MKKVTYVVIGALAQVAVAGEVSVSVKQLSSGEGDIVYGLCTGEDEFPGTCAIGGSIPANEGTVEVVVSDVDRGEYAFAVFHDMNGNGRLDLFTEAPNEGIGFSNNKMGRNGPPSFEQSVFQVGESTEIDVEMVYIPKR